MHKMSLLEKVEVMEPPLQTDFDPIYTPVRGDQIDIALCDYLNNYKDREFLKVRFVRENEGVYSFGTKKILLAATQILAPNNWLAPKMLLAPKTLFGAKSFVGANSFFGANICFGAKTIVGTC